MTGRRYVVRNRAQGMGGPPFPGVEAASSSPSLPSRKSTSMILVRGDETMLHGCSRVGAGVVCNRSNVLAGTDGERVNYRVPGRIGKWPSKNWRISVDRKW